MKYVLRGKLCGYICAQCPEPLANVTVRLYRTRGGRDVAVAATAEPKSTFAILSDAEVKRKAGSLLIEVRTDANGAFSAEIDEKTGYNGGPLQVDVYAKTVPGKPSTRFPGKPVQFSITTIQPKWRQRDEALVAVWEHCIQARFWCIIRRRFGAWVICGRVTSCENKTPLAGVKVFAFDRDWLQDDPLGDALTDADGKFRIDYASEDFATTPFSPLINLELVSGPDIYFRLEAGGGTVLLDEPPARGRDPDRENVGPCFCTELCVDVAEPPPFFNPRFTHVGDFHVITDISSATGRTNAAVLGHGGPDYGFFGATKLKGFCPKTHPVSGQPMRYRFLYEHPNNPGIEVPITGVALVAPVLVGSRLILWDLDGSGPSRTFQSIYVQGSGATPDPTPVPAVPPGTPWGPVPAHVIVPDGNGWVAVDQNALDGGFYGPLLRFNTNGAVPGGVAPGSGAGNPVGDPKNGAAIRVKYEAAPAMGPGSTFSNDLPKLHVNNWIEVHQLGLQQFLAPGASGCTPLSTALDILYTTDHELMAKWNLWITSSSGVTPPPLPGGTGPRGGHGTEHLDISSWPSCSYTVHLTKRRALTNGEIDDDADTIRVTFCK